MAAKKPSAIIDKDNLIYGDEINKNKERRKSKKTNKSSTFKENPYFKTYKTKQAKPK